MFQNIDYSVSGVVPDRHELRLHNIYVQQHKIRKRVIYLYNI